MVPRPADIMHLEIPLNLILIFQRLDIGSELSHAEERSTDQIALIHKSCQPESMSSEDFLLDRYLILRHKLLMLSR